MSSNMRDLKELDSEENRERWPMSMFNHDFQRLTPRLSEVQGLKPKPRTATAERARPSQARS